MTVCWDRQNIAKKKNYIEIERELSKKNLPYTGTPGSFFPLPFVSISIWILPFFRYRFFALSLLFFVINSVLNVVDGFIVFFLCIGIVCGGVLCGVHVPKIFIDNFHSESSWDLTMNDERWTRAGKQNKKWIKIISECLSCPKFTFYCLRWEFLVGRSCRLVCVDVFWIWNICPTMGWAAIGGFFRRKSYSDFWILRIKDGQQGIIMRNNINF
jgi:hypothetical protein